jgi:NAD(P)-dependent dehydrogenase (short-subunit alcohol dehydrogenase family)
MRFNTLIALITGANKGIGLSTTKQLLAMGYHVYLGARDEAKGEIVVGQLNAMGLLHNNAFKINCVSPGFTATDLTGNSGPQTPDEAARIIVKYATLSKDGPSGQFFGIDGQLPW